MEFSTHSKKEQSMKAKELINVLTLAQSLFDESRKLPEYIEEESSLIDQILRNSLGDNYLGGFGVGYPFYARSGDYFLKVGEINEHLSKIIANIKKESKDLALQWMCPSCQVVNSLTNLNTKCVTCNLIQEENKPIRILSTLPDIDIFIIVENLNQETKDKINQAVKDGHYYNSRISIKDTVKNVEGVLKSVQSGKKTPLKLPIDLNVLEYPKFTDAVNLMIEGEKVVVDSVALHETWENYHFPIWEDFIFSMQELGSLNDRLLSLVAKLRRGLVDHWGVEDLIFEVKDICPRTSRICETREIEESLRNKLSSWQG